MQQQTILLILSLRYMDAWVIHEKLRDSRFPTSGGSSDSAVPAMKARSPSALKTHKSLQGVKASGSLNLHNASLSE